METDSELKIAFFVEGQTESLFVAKMLREYLGARKVQIEEEVIHGRRSDLRWMRTLEKGQYLNTLCLIVDVGNDESVLSKMKESYGRMSERGFTSFIGLRDVKSRRYTEFGERMFATERKVLDSIGNGANTYLHYAMMETEAWLLAEHSAFQRLHSSLSVDYVRSKLNHDLELTDPQGLDNPTTILKHIHEIAGMSYGKKRSEVEKLLRHIEWNELFVTVKEQKKISYFFDFLDCVHSVVYGD